MLPLSIDQVIEMAIKEIEKKQQAGKLIPMSQDYNWNDPQNYSGEEPQTIYSIIALFSEFVIPQQEILLESALYQRYQKYF